MATIKDIAGITGVSTATVSNVLNGKPGAAGPLKTREIFEVAKRLQYQPNTFAKNLKKKKTNTVGIITEDLTVAQTAAIVDGIDACCEENGYEIILANMRLYKRYKNEFTDMPKHRQLFEATVRNMMAKQVEGIVYVGYHCREIIYSPTLINVPFLYAYCFPQSPNFSSVMFDDEKAGHDVTETMLKLGHRKIGFIAGPPSSYNAQCRLKGAQRALFENGVLYNAEMTKYGNWEMDSGYQLADDLLRAGVSAIFAFNDRMASGVYKCCLTQGVAVGRDISLFGYDNHEICRGYEPGISSVEPPLFELGCKCAELVMAQMKNRQFSTKPILLPCTIVMRGSVTRLAPG